MKLENGIKKLDLGNGESLYFWYSNNRGRGKNNCTIIRSKAPRADFSINQADVVAKIKTSSWRGHVNFSKAVKEALGI